MGFSEPEVFCRDFAVGPYPREKGLRQIIPVDGFGEARLGS